MTDESFAPEAEDGWLVSMTRVSDLPSDQTANEPTIEDYKRAIKIIAHRLSREAYDREWCGEYEDFVAGLNRDLGGPIQLQIHEDVTVKVTMSFSFMMDLKDVRVNTNGEDLAPAFMQEQNIRNTNVRDVLAKAAGTFIGPEADHTKVYQELRYDYECEVMRRS